MTFWVGQAAIRDSGSSFREFADEAFADLLKKHKQPVGLKAALKESVKKRPQKRWAARSVGAFYGPSEANLRADLW